MKKLIYILGLMLFVQSSFNVKTCDGQWVQKYLNMGSNAVIYSLATMNGVVFAGSGGHGLHYTFSNGDDWSTELTYTTIDGTIWCLALGGAGMYAGLSNDGVYVSPNGFNWTKTSLGDFDVRSIAVDGNTVYAGTWANGIYKSVNGGATWTQSGLNTMNVTAVTIFGNKVFAGTHDSDSPKGVYISTDNGTSWNQSSLNNKVISSFAVQGSNIFAGTFSYNPSGVFISTDYGSTWSVTSLNNKLVNTVFAYNGMLFAGVYNGGVFYSSNNGTTWTAKNEGFSTLPSVYSFIVANSYIFAGTYAYAVWRRPVSDVIGIQNISTEIPSAYSLNQNFPNPFNPTTKIRFDIAKFDDVNITVYDVLGRNVTTLVNEKLNPGSYEVNWDATGFTSGVYFYKMETPDFSKTMKMILMK